MTLNKNCLYIKDEEYIVKKIQKQKQKNKENMCASRG